MADHPCNKSYLSRQSFLIISIICFALATMLIKACIADSAPRLDIAAVIGADSELGFETGYGAQADLSQRFARVEPIIYGQWLNQCKEGHDHGHYWRYGADVRGYIYDDAYLGVGYGWSGYKTSGGGVKWSKSGHRPHYLAGYNTGQWAAGLEWYPKESTDKGIYGYAVTGRFSISESPVFGFFRHGTWRFDSGGKKYEKCSADMGIGYRF